MKKTPLFQKIWEWVYRWQPRARFLANQCNNIFQPGNLILNVGAGKGYLEDALSGSSFKIVSLEPKPSGSIEHTAIRNSFESASFNQKFNGIFFSYSFHHVNNPIQILEKALSLLTPGGKIVILEIAPQNALLKILLFKSRILCPSRKHTWTKAELSALLQRNNTRIANGKPYSWLSPLFIVEFKKEEADLQ